VPEVEPTAAPASNRAAPVPQTAPSYGNLPTLTELTLAGTMSLAPLRIDMHVYSPQPAERFVFINMNKYREGESLREGPALTTITPDGVILDYQGRSFLVTRE
jgi:general secretion pathway protein B